MSCLSREKALKIVEEIKKEIENMKTGYKRRIYSIVLFGSLVRGDFIDDVSDIDILIVFKNGTSEDDINYIIDKLNQVQKRFVYCKNYEALDIAWVFENELPLVHQPTKTFFKFLTIYAFDFIKYSEVLYGEDFRDNLLVKPPKEWVSKRIARIKLLLKKFRSDNNEKMLMILAGEIIRLAQIVFGFPTIKKDEVFSNFMKYVPDYPEKKLAIEIWNEYLTPKNKKRVDKKYIAKAILFIEKTLKVIENKLKEEFLESI